MTAGGFLDTVVARWPLIETRLTEHLFQLTLLPVTLAAVLCLPLALFAVRRPAVKNFVLALAGIFQTIPSLAMLAFLLPLLGIGKRPAIAALTLYALLPILQNAVLGIQGVPRAAKEAADAMGFSARQRLRHIELPLAAPVILGGIRTATIICVGIATLSAFIGAGGLGDFINRGLALNQVSLLLIGAGAAAALALFLDFSLETLGQWLRPGRKPARLRLRTGILAVFVLAAGTVAAVSAISRHTANDGAPIVRVGTKNFTEQIVLGEIFSQLIENTTGLSVRRVFNLGGTIICHRALERGEIDLYAEYTGTALTAILGEPPPDADERGNVLETVRAAYRDRFNLRCLPPLGFDNTYAIAVRREDARARGWRNIGDLAPVAGEIAAGFTAEFSERPDGLEGLARAYDLDFGSIRDLSPELMYSALAEGEVDVIGAFATDGRIAAHDFKILVDDLGYFPPYEAVPVVRKQLLERYPEVEAALRLLAGRLDDDTMRRLNYAVDSGEKTVAAAAREFLEEEGLTARVPVRGE